MNIALIAHDNKKELMAQFCTAYCGILAQHTLCATATTGHNEIVDDTLGALKLVPADNPVALAAAIDAWLAFPEHLRLARAAALRATKETFCWERVREDLLDEAALAFA